MTETVIYHVSLWLVYGMEVWSLAPWLFTCRAAKEPRLERVVAMQSRSLRRLSELIRRADAFRSRSLMTSPLLALQTTCTINYLRSFLPGGCRELYQRRSPSLLEELRASEFLRPLHEILEDLKQ